MFSVKGGNLFLKIRKNAAQSEFYCFYIFTDQDTIDFNKMLF